MRFRCCLAAANLAPRAPNWPPEFMRPRRAAAALICKLFRRCPLLAAAAAAKSARRASATERASERANNNKGNASTASRVIIAPRRLANSSRVCTRAWNHFNCVPLRPRRQPTRMDTRRRRRRPDSGASCSGSAGTSRGGGSSGSNNNETANDHYVGRRTACGRAAAAAPSALAGVRLHEFACATSCAPRPQITASGGARSVLANDAPHHWRSGIEFRACGGPRGPTTGRPDGRAKELFGHKLIS